MPDTPLTGTPLATALYDAGLAPTGTTRLEHLEGPSYYLASGARWRPWASWDHVAHLIERWGMSIYGFYEPPDWFPMIVGDGDHEKALTFSDIPSAIGRLSLRLEASIRNTEISHDVREPLVSDMQNVISATQT